MSTYNLPDYTFTSYDLQIEQVLSRSSSVYTKQVQTVAHQGQLFNGVFELNPMRRDRASKWAGLFAKLQVGIHNFKFCPFYERFPQSDCLSEVTLSSFSNGTSLTLDTFSVNSHGHTLTMGHTTTGGSGAWAYKTATLEADSVYVLTFYATVTKGSFTSDTDNELKVLMSDTSEASTAAETNLISEGWNRHYYTSQSAGTHWFKFFYEATSLPAEFSISHVKLHKVIVNTDYVSRQNKFAPVNGAGGRDFDSFDLNVTGSTIADGIEADFELTATGGSSKNACFQVQNLVSGAWYKITLDLTLQSGTISGTTRAGFVAATSDAPSASSTIYAADISTGSNTIFIQSNQTGDDNFFVVHFDATTAFDANLTNVYIHKMSVNPEIDSVSTVSLGTAANGGSPNDHGTFTGATTTGFTAGHDGLGGDDKYATLSATLDSSKKYLITFDIVKNSGASPLTNVVLGFGTSGVSDLDPFLRMRSTEGTQSIIIQPDGDDNQIGFVTASSADINYTVSNLVVYELPDYGSDTLAGNGSLQLIGPGGQTTLFQVGDYLTLPNSQMIQFTETINTNNVGHVSTTVFPNPRGAITTGQECEVICPEIRFLIDGNSITTGIRQPGGLIAGMSFTATEYIDQ